MNMDKKEFVQRFMIENPSDSVQWALEKWDEIENAFVVIPTTNLWDYNDMQR
jgi:hypothetical protein